MPLNAVTVFPNASCAVMARLKLAPAVWLPTVAKSNLAKAAWVTSNALEVTLVAPFGALPLKLKAMV